ncbi:MAG: peptide transporter [Victivallales bacterium]|nr:peptide transporter [Victivallales bacterium]
MTARARKAHHDAELELYRGILDEPTEYKDAFTWTTVLGAIFCGTLMLPGAIYLGLITGGGMGAAPWVTLIIFSEVSRRAMKSLNRQEVVLLLTVAGAMMAAQTGVFGGFVYRAFVVRSDPVMSAGLAGQFPDWWAPAADSAAITERSFLHIDWLKPFLIFGLTTWVLSFIKRYTLGYALFRLTSDFERLPFPFAPIAAQGAMAIAEAGDKKNAWKWRAFSSGTMIGLGFGIFYVGLPVISGAFLAKPMMLFPIPWYDMTTVTEGILPAVPTGITWHLSLVITGMIIPWRAIQGTGLAILLTFVLNPILVKTGVLTTWQPGMGTIDTGIANRIDFYFSFGIGCAMGIAIISLCQTGRAMYQNIREKRQARKDLVGDSHDPWTIPVGRGDWSLKLCAIGYFVAGTGMCVLCKYLVPDFPVKFLVFFAFIFTPVLSYLNARMIAVNGQHVDIPFIKEGAILLSGTKGLNVWLAPFPEENFGNQAASFRVKELTGTKFTSLVKLDLFRMPLTILLGFIFWSFIWHSNEIPSATFPWTEIMWDQRIKNSLIMWSATTGDGLVETMFDKAFKPWFLAIGTSATCIMFFVLRSFGAPIMFVYGFVRGIGRGCHVFVLEIIGALVARLYLNKKYGRERMLRVLPVIMAGYLVGEGLVGMACVAVTLISKAISGLPL